MLLYNNNNNIQHLYSVLLYFTLKRCCEYYKIDSDFFNLGYINLNQYVTSIPSAHVLIHVNTHTLTIHTYGIHNDITTHNPPNVTVINVN